MPSGVKITGVDKVISKLFKGELKYEHSLEAALKMSLNIVRANARLLLDEYVYNKPGASSSTRHLTGDLRKKIRVQVQVAAGGVAIGSVDAISPEAFWIEHGTARHEVAAVNVQAMHFEYNGRDYFSVRHMIDGVYATHFMRDALAMSRPEIMEIFRMAFGETGFNKGPLEYLLIGSGIVEEDDQITGHF